MDAADARVMQAVVEENARVVGVGIKYLTEKMMQCTSMICATVYVSFATGHDGDAQLMARLQDAMRKLLEPEPEGGVGEQPRAV